MTKAPVFTLGLLLNSLQWVKHGGLVLVSEDHLRRDSEALLLSSIPLLNQPLNTA